MYILTQIQIRSWGKKSLDSFLQNGVKQTFLTWLNESERFGLTGHVKTYFLAKLTSLLNKTVFFKVQLQFSDTTQMMDYSKLFKMLTNFFIVSLLMSAPRGVKNMCNFFGHDYVDLCYNFIIKFCSQLIYNHNQVSS